MLSTNSSLIRTQLKGVCGFCFIFWIIYLHVSLFESEPGSPLTVEESSPIPILTPTITLTPAIRTELISYSNKTPYPPAVLVAPIGGIGNQLFMFACSYAVAKENNWTLYIRLTEELDNRKFSLNNREFCLDQFQVPTLHVYDKTTALLPGSVHLMDDDQFLKRQLPEQKKPRYIQLNGYCQSEAFWHNHQDELRSQLQPSEQLIVPTLSDKLYKIYQQIEQVESVAVHVRRGDFLNLGENAFYTPLTYQRVAIHRMSRILKEKEMDSPIYFIFSDDIQFVRRSFADLEQRYKFVYVSELNTTSVQDFFLMIRCKHIILPNSTFSWWAAFLNENKNQTVISSAFNPEWWRQLGNKRIHGTLYHPSNWVVIDVFNGEQ